MSAKVAVLLLLAAGAVFVSTGGSVVLEGFCISVTKLGGCHRWFVWLTWIGQFASTVDLIAWANHLRETLGIGIWQSGSNALQSHPSVIAN
jgi:hypothetical protein